jgi:hypothetical protein
MAEEKQPESENKNNRLSTLVALLIAAVSVTGAVVTWRASVSADGAGDADVAGIRATINLTETNALAAVKGYSDYASFTDYYKYRETSKQLEKELTELTADATEGQADALNNELADTYDLTVASGMAFPNDYLNRDGTYALSRQTGEYVANASREKDINPQPSFDEADGLRSHTNRLLDGLRSHTNRLLITLSVLVVALVFYTLIEASENKKFKYLLLVAGTGIFVAGTIGAYLVEMGML